MAQFSLAEWLSFRWECPNGTTSRVSYRFVEASPYASRSVLVVGGGNSAAEAALSLADVGARVTLSFRQAGLDSTAHVSAAGRTARNTSAKIKPWVREPLERAVADGRVDILPSSEVKEILPGSAVLYVERAGKRGTVEIACEHIFALIGADPDTRLLERAGAEMAEDGRPVYDPETYETTVEGLYVAGHITRDLHMKNAGPVARRVVDSIASKVVPSRQGRETRPAS